MHLSNPRTTVHDLVEQARSRLRRLSPAEALAAQREGAVLVDTRSEDQRATQGRVPGARCIPLSVLEWVLDPSSGENDATIGLDHWVVVLCAEGYSSSLAAARLQTLGFHRATDVVGGVVAWLEAGLPLERARS